jgi:hypothetical protein
MGSGNPTVILDAGSGNSMATWRHVQEEIGKSTCKRGLNQHGPGDIFGIGRHVKKDDSAGKRMSDANERRRNARRFYEPVQVVDDVA